MKAACQKVAEGMTRYVDGLMSADERATFEEHLRRCPPCREGAGEEASGRAVLRECAQRLRSEPLPPELRSRCEALAHHPLRRWWRSLFRSR
jgi:anti-sigma factor (TIGR02949 family)